MRLLGLVIGAVEVLANAISFALPGLRLSLERSVATSAGLHTLAIPHEDVAARVLQGSR